jgi:3-hydroxyisobutyrate dehydrogenase-like beta-hydroxyacid dehydrogenase
MGSAMAIRLHGEGFPLVLYNRTRSKAEQVASRVGAEVAETPRRAAEQATVVLSSLADDRAVRSVFGDPEGAARGLQAGAVVLEMSTIDPRTIHAIRPLIEQAGAALVDAPVSGSVSLVERGELTIMAGGAEDDLAKGQPVLEALATRILHVGDLGSGATMKLAVNALVHAINMALSEALVLAEKAGVDRATAYEVFASGAAAAPFVLYKRAAFERPDEAPVAFSLELVAKDLDLILDLAEQVGARMDQSATNRRLAGLAIEAGLGERDMSAVASFLRGA